MIIFGNIKILRSIYGMTNDIENDVPHISQELQ